MGANVLLLYLLLLFGFLLVDKARSDGDESEEEEYPRYEGYEEDDWVILSSTLPKMRYIRKKKNRSLLRTSIE